MAQREPTGAQDWFAENLRYLMEVSGYRAENVAHYTGVTKRAVEKWADGASSPRTRLIKRIAWTFGRTVDEVLGPPGDLRRRYKRWEDLGLSDERRPFVLPRSPSKLRSATGALLQLLARAADRALGEAMCGSLSAAA